jgi:cytidine deaminase
VRRTGGARARRASGARELAAIVAVGNFGRGPVGPCGRDRQILFDYHPGIRVILPTPNRVRSVKITDLMPLGAVWTPEEGTQEFDPSLFSDG